MTEFDERLAATFGPAVAYSDYARGDVVRYQVPGGAIYTGTIIWIVAAGASQIEGHADQPQKYVIERDGWEGFPDFAISSDILGLEGPQEPLIREV